jgi:hypothetical protein
VYAMWARSSAGRAPPLRSGSVSLRGRAVALRPRCARTARRAPSGPPRAGADRGTAARRTRRGVPVSGGCPGISAPPAPWVPVGRGCPGISPRRRRGPGGRGMPGDLPSAGAGVPVGGGCPGISPRPAPGSRWAGDARGCPLRPLRDGRQGAVGWTLVPRRHRSRDDSEGSTVGAVLRGPGRWGMPRAGSRWAGDAPGISPRPAQGSRWAGDARGSPLRRRRGPGGRGMPGPSVRPGTGGKGRWAGLLCRGGTDRATIPKVPPWARSSGVQVAGGCLARGPGGQGMPGDLPSAGRGSRWAEDARGSPLGRRRGPGGQGMPGDVPPPAPGREARVGGLDSFADSAPMARRFRRFHRGRGPPGSRSLGDASRGVPVGGGCPASPVGAGPGSAWRWGRRSGSTASGAGGGQRAATGRSTHSAPRRSPAAYPTAASCG